MHATYRFYNDAKRIGRLAEAAQHQVERGDKAAALETLRLINEKYGDLFGVGLNLRDAIAELEVK